jgi:hypothetical protein
VTPQAPPTRLRQLAQDLNRLADELASETQLDPNVFRYLRRELLDICAELERSATDPRRAV